MTSKGTQLPPVLQAAEVDPASVERYDVVVVGFGIGGGCAALEAARAGAKVLLLERAAVHGGTTSMAGGHFYLGGGTVVQKATGQADTPEEMFKYLMATSPDPDEEKFRAYCEDSPAHCDWLEGLGFEFERSFYPKKNVIQPGTEGLMYTGNEKVWPYKNMAVPAPRGHKVPKAGDTGGASIVTDLLKERCAEAGVEVRYETGVTQLVTDAAGDVVGVVWKSFENTGVVHANGVVLAAGGFVMNPDMVAEHTPALGGNLFTLGSTYDDGLGLRLGASVGAELKHMDEPFITAPFYPPSRRVKGLVVNNLGQRFVAEDSYHSRTTGFVLDQPDAQAWLVVDSEHIGESAFDQNPLVDGWETIEEMERDLGLPEGALVATMATYNENAARGEDPDFHKAAEWLAPQTTGPWAAFNMSLGKAMHAGFTLGGMRTDVDARVQREDGTLIKGLYAAGSCASNIAVDGKSYCSGTQLGEGSYFGRRAGRHAATR